MSGIWLHTNTYIYSNRVHILKRATRNAEEYMGKRASSNLRTAKWFQSSSKCSFWHRHWHRLQLPTYSTNQLQFEINKHMNGTSTIIFRLLSNWIAGWFWVLVDLFVYVYSFGILAGPGRNMEIYPKCISKQTNIICIYNFNELNIAISKALKSTYLVHIVLICGYW